MARHAICTGPFEASIGRLVVYRSNVSTEEGVVLSSYSFKTYASAAAATAERSRAISFCWFGTTPELGLFGSVEPRKLKETMMESPATMATYQRSDDQRHVATIQPTASCST